MTSKVQKKLQKRKSREKDARKKVLVRREAIRAPIRKEKEEILRQKKIRKLQRDLEQFDQVMTDREMFEASDDTLSQLEKNVMILKALEEEYNREMEKKEKINERLESEGYYTLEEKMQAAREIYGSDMGVGGSAGASFSVKKPMKDVSEVSVVNNPLNESSEIS